MRILAALAATAALGGAACTDDGQEAATTTTPPTTTQPAEPPGSADPRGSSQPSLDEPPEPAWVLQVGTAADDTLSSVTGRDDTVLAVGDTAGDLGTGSGGALDAMLLVADTEGEVVSLRQSGDAGDDRALGVSSGSNSTAGDVTIACGATTSGLVGPNAGGSDAWCGRVGAETIEFVHQQGSPLDDELVAVAIEQEATAGAPDNPAVGYAAGSTFGLFPGASDTSAGLLGAGDAMFWMLDANGFPLWIRQLGTENEDRGRAAGATSDGDGVLAGHTGGDLDGPSNGGTDAFVTRFDPDGIPRWIAQFGSQGEDVANAVGVGGDPARGTEAIVAAGSTTGSVAPVLGAEVTSPLDAPRADGGEPAPSNAGGRDALVSAFDATGDPLWDVQLGTVGDDQAAAVATDGQTVLVAGSTDGALATTGEPAAGATDGFLAALDRDTGALRWITQFGSPGEDVVTAMTTTEDGLVVISGTTTDQMGDQPNAGGLDGFLIAFPLPSAGGAVASAL